MFGYKSNFFITVVLIYSKFICLEFKNTQINNCYGLFGGSYELEFF